MHQIGLTWAGESGSTENLLEERCDAGLREAQELEDYSEKWKNSGSLHCKELLSKTLLISEQN